jgi:hypothetical protein
MGARTRLEDVGVAVVALVAWLAGSSQAWAQPEPDSVVVDVGDCVELESREERLACFEARVDASLGEPAPQSAEIPDDTPVPTRTIPPAEPRASAGSASSRRAPDSRPSEASSGEPETPDEIVSTVTALQEREPNAYLITLQNGQVWRQTRPRQYYLRVGYEVRLRATRWGTSYRLSSDVLGGYIQVERIR